MRVLLWSERKVAPGRNAIEREAGMENLPLHIIGGFVLMAVGLGFVYLGVAILYLFFVPMTGAIQGIRRSACRAAPQDHPASSPATNPGSSR
jgi:Na+-transporting methylmalonyl-CoA/oxaloacetate decarboxylase gamma subunit